MSLSSARKSQRWHSAEVSLVITLRILSHPASWNEVVDAVNKLSESPGNRTLRAVKERWLMIRKGMEEPSRLNDIEIKLLKMAVEAVDGKKWDLVVEEYRKLAKGMDSAERKTLEKSEAKKYWEGAFGECERNRTVGSKREYAAVENGVDESEEVRFNKRISGKDNHERRIVDLDRDWRDVEPELPQIQWTPINN